MYSIGFVFIFDNSMTDRPLEAYVVQRHYDYFDRDDPMVIQEKRPCLTLIFILPDACGSEATSVARQLAKRVHIHTSIYTLLLQMEISPCFCVKCSQKVRLFRYLHGDGASLSRTFWASWGALMAWSALPTSPYSRIYERVMSCFDSVACPSVCQLRFDGFAGSQCGCCQHVLVGRLHDYPLQTLVRCRT